MNLLNRLLRRGPASTAELHTPADMHQQSIPANQQPKLPTLRQVLESSAESNAVKQES